MVRTVPFSPMWILAAQINSSLFDMGIPVAEKVIRTLAVYLGLVLLLRLAGKREVAQLNSFDLVVLLLLSNVVQNAVIGPDNSLIGGLLGAGILLGINAVVVRVVGSNKAVAAVVEGTATDVVLDGKVDEKSLRRLGLRPNEVMAAIRRQGASSIDEVQHATISPGGVVMVELRKEDENATKGDVARLEQKLDALLGGVD